jgi:ribonuclease D
MLMRCASRSRQRLVRDESLLELAATMPATAEALGRIRGISRGFAEGSSGQGLLAALAEVAALPEDALPDGRVAREGPKPSPALVALLKVLLAEKAEAHDVAPKLLASADDLDRLATEEHPDIQALHGWRHLVFGEDALALKAGRIALGVSGRRIKLIRS